MMAKTVVILGTMDTKGEEFAYVKKLIEGHGINTLVVDSGVLEEPKLKPDVSREEVARAGGKSIAELVEKKDRGQAMDIMSRGAAVVIERLYKEGKLDGIIGMGGSGGTAVATAGMRALPVGVPKVMVSTLASGDVSPYVSTRDITMIPSVVDVAGLNGISRKIFANAVGAIARKGGSGKAADSRNHVWEHDTVRGSGQGKNGGSRIRGPGVPLYRRRRTHYGRSDRRRIHHWRARHNYHRVG